MHLAYLPPAPNEVLGKLMFLLESVILSRGRGVVSVWGSSWQRPLWTETPLDRDPPGHRPPRWRPPWTDTPWTDTPGSRHPGQRPPLDRDPQIETSQTDPPPGQRPPGQRLHLTDTPPPANGKEWAVRILLESILVIMSSCVVRWLMTKIGGYAFLFKWKSKGNTEKWQISSKIE